VPIPAGGQLDELTLAHLGVQDYPISAGGSAATGSSAERTAEPKAN
jgi:hypothetical protein